MKRMEVTILGQSYALSCPDGGEAALVEAASQVDREMCAIRDAGKLKARERIAVLAALNLAYGLPKSQALQAAIFPPVVAPPAAAHALPAAAEQTRIDALIALIDETLADDGRLL